jgi:DNA-binding NarL/FixJ family response regulator
VTAIRVAVLSDDRLLCDGLSYILGADTSLSLVAPSVQWSSGLAPVEGADVLLVDSRMPAVLDFCSTVRRDGGPPVILFMVARDDDGWTVDALAAGARGVLAKDGRADELLKAIHVVHEGQIWARRQTVEAWAKRIADAPTPARISALEQGLSSREREVLRHAATGLSNKELAGRLAISEATVKVHLTHIFQKLGVRGRAELAAAYHGLIRSTSAGGSAGGVLRPPA